MYTRDELEQKTKSEITPIAEGLGLEYTTKVKTIDAILSVQDQAVQDGNDPDPESPALDLAPRLIPEPVQTTAAVPSKPPLPTPPSFPTGIYQSLGMAYCRTCGSLRTSACPLGDTSKCQFR